MKKILLLLILSGFFTGSLIAGTKTSTLIIKASGSDMISVALGDLPFSDVSNEVSIRNLEKGKHFVRVMKHSRGFFRSRSEIIYEGYITIKRKREVVAVIDSSGNLVIIHDEKIKKNKPYYQVDDTKSRRQGLNVTIMMDKISVF